MSGAMDVRLGRSRLRELREGAVVVPDDPAIFRLTGPGALQCLQGVLTSDVVQPGDRTLLYGALLTPKGMIVVDLWVMRLEAELLLVGDRIGREPALELFRKQLPPRLAKAADLSESWSAAWVLGRSSSDLVEAAGIPVPHQAGHAAIVPVAGRQIHAAGGTPEAPFRALLVGPREAMDAVRAGVLAGGLGKGGAADLRGARILAGWPTLGAEIDEKTLPQEVRYDEIGGVSYTKGCYVGQETVARIHFRGHPNRLLRGLIIEGGAPLGERRVERDGKEIGVVRSAVVLEDQVIALGMIRREVGIGDEVAAGGRRARVESLPFGGAV